MDCIEGACAALTGVGLTAASAKDMISSFGEIGGEAFETA
jgi:hypothetical protein